MAFENIVGTNATHRRWIIAFCFGLVHGFGFSFALRQTLQLAGTHLLASLLAFNVGVELGQILVLALIRPALYSIFRFAGAERVGTFLLSALVAHTGWHWTIERGERLRQYSFGWTDLNASALAGIGWSLLFLVVLLGSIRLLVNSVRRPARSTAQNQGDLLSNPFVNSAGE